MAYFKDPLNILQGELEEVQDDIGKKEKAIREFDKQIRELERQKELTEGELDDLLSQEKEVKRKINKTKIEQE